MAGDDGWELYRVRIKGGNSSFGGLMLEVGWVGGGHFTYMTEHGKHNINEANAHEVGWKVSAHQFILIYILFYEGKNGVHVFKIHTNV